MQPAMISVPPKTTKLIVTPEDTLQFGKILGSGAFGTVYEVINSTSKIAVKVTLHVYCSLLLYL